MIYENVVLAHSSSDEKDIEALVEMMSSVVSQRDGEVLKQDNWGTRRLAQASDNGQTRGIYLYMLYRGNGDINKELNRRFRINEKVINYLTVKIGGVDVKQKALDSYQFPFAAK